VPPPALRVALRFDDAMVAGVFLEVLPFFEIRRLNWLLVVVGDLLLDEIGECFLPAQRLLVLNVFLEGGFEGGLGSIEIELGALSDVLVGLGLNRQGYFECLRSGTQRLLGVGAFVRLP